MELLYLVITFLAGGSIVAGTTFLADSIDPKYGGILAVAPIITTVAFVFTGFGAGHERTQGLVQASLVFLVPTALFLAALYLLLDRFSLPVGLIGAYGVWLVAVLVIGRMMGIL